MSLPQRTMSKEIIIGIIVGLLSVALVVFIGSFIGQTLSHGPKHGVAHKGAVVPKHGTEPVNPTDTETGAEAQNTPKGPGATPVKNDANANIPAGAPREESPQKDALPKTQTGGTPAPAPGSP